MDREELRKYIISVGFKSNGYHYYIYKEFRLNLYLDCYDLHNGSEWKQYYLNDFTPIIKLIRGYKLKGLLD